jgi:hypothetical protein
VGDQGSLEKDAKELLILGKAGVCVNIPKWCGNVNQRDRWKYFLELTLDGLSREVDRFNDAAGFREALVLIAGVVSSAGVTYNPPTLNSKRASSIPAGGTRGIKKRSLNWKFSGESLPAPKESFGPEGRGNCELRN